jgi:hypothetical protein
LACLAWFEFVSMLVLAQEHTDYMFWSSAVHVLPGWLCVEASFESFNCSGSTLSGTLFSCPCPWAVTHCCFVEFDCARFVRCLMAGD